MIELLIKMADAFGIPIALAVAAAAVMGFWIMRMEKRRQEKEDALELERQKREQVMSDRISQLDTRLYEAQTGVLREVAEAMTRMCEIGENFKCVGAASIFAPHEK